ncbi:uncharacterized protein LOC141913341 [Tubulanus polymorphus]|uniref:uncharacterized protein LOC141913341 n=1 Tax=Tubulanus polymorphus TaxID=672921 RepID=UPI003DA2F37E
METKQRSQYDTIDEKDSFRRKLARFLDSHHVLIIICVLVVLDAAMVIGQLMIDLYIIRERFAKGEQSLHKLVGILQQDYPSLRDFHGEITLDDVIDKLENRRNFYSRAENASLFQRGVDDIAERADINDRHRRALDEYDDIPNVPNKKTIHQGAAADGYNATGIKEQDRVYDTGGPSEAAVGEASVDRVNGSDTGDETSLPPQSVILEKDTRGRYERRSLRNDTGAIEKDSTGHHRNDKREIAAAAANRDLSRDSLAAPSTSDSHPPTIPYGMAPARNRSSCSCSNSTMALILDPNATRDSDICDCDFTHTKKHDDTVHLLEEMAHAFHLASIAILCLMTLEKLLIIFGLGMAIIHKKMEIFDTFVVVSSFLLDLVLLEGVWATTEKDAALFLVILLPWRVIRIVNCFVMTMKQRHHIRMQLQKHARRKAQKKVKLYKKHIERLRRQIKSLKGLCRKHGAEEREINACAFVFTESRRRKSSLPVNAMSTMASLALIGVIGNDPHITNKDEPDPEDLAVLDEKDEDEYDEAEEDAMQLKQVTMNGKCHDETGIHRKISTISGTDSIEISCGSGSAESGSPLQDRSRLDSQADSVIDLTGLISDDSDAPPDVDIDDSEQEQETQHEEKILKSRRFSTTDFLHVTRKSIKRAKKQGKK